MPHLQDLQNSDCDWLSNGENLSPVNRILYYLHKSEIIVVPGFMQALTVSSRVSTVLFGTAIRKQYLSSQQTPLNTVIPRSVYIRGNAHTIVTVIHDRLRIFCGNSMTHLSLLRKFLPYYYSITEHRTGSNFARITLPVCKNTGRHIDLVSPNLCCILFHPSVGKEGEIVLERERKER